jgi:hypothetical protein
MGMFNDNRNTNRDGWRFTYLGSDLLPFARKKYAAFTAAELKARSELADKMKDPIVSLKDPKIDELKGQIEYNGNEREKCMVWVHEFGRAGSNTYTLGLGDVTYFDLVTPETLRKE